MMPRLSADLEGVAAPDTCRACSAMAYLGAELSRWQEHDEADRPELVLVVLCRACSRKLIERHPRLYRELDPCEPWPGAMNLCVDCAHRDGTRCGHPDARANGGPGVGLTIVPPIVAHLSRSPRRLSGFVTTWRLPASACAQKEGVPS